MPGSKFHSLRCYDPCMRFDLTDLRLFLRAETGSITAGGRSNMTLASASERASEDTLGVRCCAARAADRRRRRTLAHHARLVLAQMDRMRGDLDQYGQGLKGPCACNATPRR